IMFLSLVVISVAGIGSVAALEQSPDVNATNNTVLSPSANATVNNSGNSQNVNTNTIIVKSTNVNRQIQVQKASPRTIVVYVKTVPVAAATTPSAAGGEVANASNSTNAGNGTNVPMQTTGVNFIPLAVGLAGLAGGYLASRFRS
ncbi:MAG TPA: hypothetical protein VK426_03515, partial [Methanobacterium sp.]|nr:hypothetical protein [Methanobacterium sp.]